MSAPARPTSLADLLRCIDAVAHDEAALRAMRHRLFGGASPAHWLALCRGSVAAGEPLDWWPAQRSRLAPLLSTAFAVPELHYANCWTQLSLDCSHLLCDAHAGARQADRGGLRGLAMRAAVARGVHPLAGSALLDVLRGVPDVAGSSAEKPLQVSLPVALVDRHSSGGGYLADLDLILCSPSLESDADETLASASGLYPALECALVCMHDDFKATLEQAWGVAVACHPVLAVCSVCWGLRLRSGALPAELSGQSAGAALAAGLITLGGALAQAGCAGEGSSSGGAAVVTGAAVGRQ